MLGVRCATPAILMSKRTAIDQAVGELLGFVRRAPWDDRLHELLMEHLTQAAEDLGIEVDEIPAMLEASGVGHMLFGMVMEHLMTKAYEEPPHNLIEDFVKRRGRKLPPAGRSYLLQLQDSMPGYYEVVDVAPGAHVVVRDLLRAAEPIRVTERQGSRSLYRWDRLAARVLRRDGRHVFSGAFLPFRGVAGEALLEAWREVEQEARELCTDAEILDELEQQGFDEPEREALVAVLARQQLAEVLPILCTQAWLVATLEALHAPPPQLHNREGDPLLFGEARFAVVPGREPEVAARLDALHGWARAEGAEPFWNWIAEPDARATGSGLSLHTEIDGRTVLGAASLQGGDLVFTANSQRRTERGVALLQEALSDALDAPRIGYTAVAELLAHQAGDDGAPNAEAEAETGGIAPEDRQRIVAQAKDRHYARVLSEPIPALGDRSPRDCLGDPEGRARVIAWLKQLENNEQRMARSSGQPVYDSRWLWEELGLSPAGS